MSYEVKLDVFEGPLDLLLHLINKNEVDITNIPIALVTRQYLETIELMKSLNLDVAGEYLVMAAYLTHIKSQMLLPTQETEDDGEGIEDPREELVAHLLEYKRYKEAAYTISGFEALDRDVFIREFFDDQVDVSPADVPLEVGMTELLDAFRSLLERTSRRDLIEVEPDRLLVKDKINEILERLKHHRFTTFGALFEEDFSRLNVVTTFLALLEIVKLQLVSLYQDRPFETILITRRSGTDPDEETEENGDDSDVREEAAPRVTSTP